MKIGQKIKKLRELKNFTQEYMAVQLDMSTGNFSRLERDEVPLTINKLNSISKILGINYLDILTFDEKSVFSFINGTNEPNTQVNIHNKNYSCSPSLLKDLIKRIEALEQALKEKSKE
jgi:transcriptional regulator with XRE-family HTH domain